MIKLAAIFPDFDERLIEHLQKAGEIVMVKNGEHVIRPGQYFKSAIVVLEGTVKLSIEGERGAEMFLYFLEPGKICALSIGSSSGKNINIRAKAASKVTLLLIPMEQMELLIRTYPRWNHYLLEAYNARFNDLLQAFYQIAFYSMDKKLRDYLRRHFSALNTKTITITHQEIASDLNSSREVVSRHLKKLEADHLITISRNEISNIAL